ncbi:hypothetical protein Athai_40610 [Actinocatenispora thailandica]|uniref:SigE family RNA polymerase sigma factor n=1 Tax=Actinocatenispora thailandica TaxID=227318 RepID=A0A7R7HY00_9ACTN|nr:SigE family RNA polymerase sigma factor [Actinocatenispora thailandica]BCJ36558.1 hypothetical protein Athai_40610 [Actinocatenispora thailandica]
MSDDRSPAGGHGSPGPRPEQVVTGGPGTDDPDGAYEDFYRRRSQALLRYGYVLAGNPHDAADLVQEAFARLRVAWRRVRRRTDPEGYVRTTMVRLHVSRWRRLRRERVVADPPEAADEDAAMRRVGDDRGLWSQLAVLPPRQRAVLVLRYYDDRSDEEIADMLGVTKVTVRTQAHRALARLRDRWTPAAEPQKVVEGR